MIELRWREGNDKGGAWVLQMRQQMTPRADSPWTEWKDVPQQPAAAPKSSDDIYKAICGYCSSGQWNTQFIYCPECGRNVMEVIAPSPPKSSRQQKADELTAIFIGLTKMWGRGCERNMAEAALEWIEKQIPQDSDGGDIYISSSARNKALSDMRHALLGEDSK